MKKYKTLEIVSLYAGVRVGLTPAQAGSRMHNLEETEDEGVFQVVNPVQFKAGETLELGKVDKIVASKLESLKQEREKTKSTGRGRRVKPDES